MSAYDFLFWAPLVSAGIWFSLAGYLTYQERYRTWTELFFVLLCMLTGGYALGDAIFFNMPPGADLTLEASVSLTCLTVGSVFLLLYGMAFHGRFRRASLLIFIPAAFFIASFPTHMFAGFPPLPPGPVPRVPQYNLDWYLPWLLFVAACWLGALIQIGRTVFEVHGQSPKLAHRIEAILVGFVAALLAGTFSNAVLGLEDAPGQPPLFSTFLAVPGFLIFFATSPSASRRLNDALRRKKASTYDVKGAFLTFSDGTLIGSRIQPEERMIDADSFSATLDVISNFMRTSFPTLRGKWLKSIRHGNYTLLMERGRHACLTLILDGEENDQLRRLVIEAVEKFEEENAEALSNWRGMAKDARGVDNLLTALLAAS